MIYAPGYRLEGDLYLSSDVVSDLKKSLVVVSS